MVQAKAPAKSKFREGLRSEGRNGAAVAPRREGAVLHFSQVAADGGRGERRRLGFSRGHSQTAVRGAPQPDGWSSLLGRRQRPTLSGSVISGTNAVTAHHRGRQLDSGTEEMTLPLQG